MSHWDERYRAGEGLDAPPSPLLEKAARLASPGRALDLACGAGRHAARLAELGWRVTAVDASAAAIEHLRTRAPAVDARVADLEAGGFLIVPAAWDLICDFHYLQRNLFPAVQRGLREGGLFVAQIHLFDPSPEVRPMNPAFLLRPGELRAIFAEWELLHEAEGDNPEAGAGHRRRVAEIIARKPAAAGLY